jgi:hypothetical protein
MGYTMRDLERSSKEKPAVRLPPPGPATEAAPAAPTTESAPVKDQITATPDDPNFSVLDTSYVNGNPINLIAFMRGIPSMSLTDASDVGDATLILKQMQYALAVAGLPTKEKIPIRSAATNEYLFNTYMQSIANVVEEIKSSCTAISKSIKEEVNKKQKEERKKISDPKVPGQGEVYRFEALFWKAPILVIGQVAKAQQILSASAFSLPKGRPQNLLALLKSMVNTHAMFGGTDFDEVKAKAIGKLILDSEGPFAENIDPSDTSKYFNFNHDEVRIKAEIAPAIGLLQTRIDAILKPN